jgi:hypothetical protein
MSGGTFVIMLIMYAHYIKHQEIETLELKHGQTAVPAHKADLMVERGFRLAMIGKDSAKDRAFLKRLLRGEHGK